MGIRDRNIDWLRARRRIPWNEFNIDTAQAAPGDGGAVWGELSTFHYGGILVGAANDEWSTLDVVSPTLWDPAHAIGVRVLWATEGTVATNDAIVWRVNYDQNDIGEALTDPAQGAGTALDTAIATQSPSVTTTLVTYRSPRGIINANTFDHTSRNGVIAWQVDVPTLTNFSANEVVFLALEIDYMPLVCESQEESRDALTADLS